MVPRLEKPRASARRAQSIRTSPLVPRMAVGSPIPIFIRASDVEDDLAARVSLLAFLQRFGSLLQRQDLGEVRLELAVFDQLIDGLESFARTVSREGIAGDAAPLRGHVGIGKSDKACPASIVQRLERRLACLGAGAVEERIGAACHRLTDRVGPAPVVVIEYVAGAETAGEVGGGSAGHADDASPGGDRDLHRGAADAAAGAGDDDSSGRLKLERVA